MNSRKATQILRGLAAGLLIIWAGTCLLAAPPEIHVIEDGQAQIIPEAEDPSQWIRHDLFVETEFDSDGDGQLDRMHVSVTRPRQTDTAGWRLPVIYVTSPYFGGTNPGGREYFWPVRHELGATPPQRQVPEPFDAAIERPVISNSHIHDWVPRGFVVVHSSSPGTGLSQGCPTVGGDNESLAPKAVIDWLCGRAKGYTEIDNDEEVVAYWSNGRVGMTGTSYNGTLPLAAATTGVQGLEVIIPIAPNTSYYHYYRSNGLVRHPGGWMGEDIDVLYDFIHSGNPERRDWCDCHIRDQLMRKHQDRETGDYNDFWMSRDYWHDLDGMRCPMLMAHAFNDWNVVPEHSIRIYRAAREKGLMAHLYMHQDGHGGPPPFTMMNRWFSRYLLEVDNGVERGPRAWIVREHAKRDEPTAYEDYPHPDARMVLLYPSRGGVQRGCLVASRGASSEGCEQLTDNFSFDGATLAKAEWTDHRLLYVTKPLGHQVHISGFPKVHIRLAADKPAANLSVWLVALPWEEGREVHLVDNLITRGWADPQNAGNLRHSTPLVPGEFREWEFELQPDDQIIPPGQQIGLMIMSTDRDFTLHPNPGTRIMVDLDRTWIELPVVGGIEAWRHAIDEEGN